MEKYPNDPPRIYVRPTASKFSLRGEGGRGGGGMIPLTIELRFGKMNRQFRLISIFHTPLDTVAL